MNNASSSDLSEFSCLLDLLSVDFIFSFSGCYIHTASPFLRFPTRCTGSHFIFSLSHCFSSRLKGREKKRKEKWKREINGKRTERTGCWVNEKDGESGWKREPKIGKGVHRYPGHGDRAGIYSTAEPVRGIWLKELTHASTRRGFLRVWYQRLPNERNRHFDDHGRSCYLQASGFGWWRKRLRKNVVRRLV